MKRYNEEEHHLKNPQFDHSKTMQETMRERRVSLENILEFMEYLGNTFSSSVNEPDCQAHDPVRLLRDLINAFVYPQLGSHIQCEKLFKEINQLLGRLDATIAPHSKFFALLFGIRGCMANGENAEGSHSKETQEFITDILETEQYYAYKHEALPIDSHNIITSCLWLSDLPEDLSAWCEEIAQESCDVSFKMPLYPSKCPYLIKGIVHGYQFFLVQAMQEMHGCSISHCSMLTPIFFKGVSLEAFKLLMNFASQEASTEKMELETEYTVTVEADYFLKHLEAILNRPGEPVLTEVPFRKQYAGNCFLYNFIFSHLASKNYEKTSPLISYYVLSKLIIVFIAAVKAEIQARITNNIVVETLHN